MNNNFIQSIVVKYNLSVPDSETYSLFEQLQISMQERIRLLLDTHPEKLIQILYLLDIDELLVEKLLHQSELVSIPEKLTELILVREYQKQHTFQKNPNQE